MTIREMSDWLQIMSEAGRRAQTNRILKNYLESPELSGITLRQKCSRDNLNPQNCGTFFQLLDNLPANYCVQVYPREFTQLKAKDLLLFSVYCTFVVIIRKMQTIHGTSVNCCFTFRAINFFTASFVQQEIQDSDGQRFC